MTGTEIAAILGALGTFIGAVLLAVRGVTGDRFRRKVTESAALLSGYTEQVKNLRAELVAAREAHDEEIKRIQARHMREIEHVNHLHKVETARLEAERERLEERVDELEGKVTALLYRPHKNQREGDK